ncbi:hypothetical protein ACFYLL_17635 [Proteus mirabilis]|uniref:hypothetical protein n=1 Tax=Proteus mirabilis TaxID=584 RepID=UPI00368A3016|nr:hypothetical protein [Proteus mirabilis]
MCNKKSNITFKDVVLQESKNNHLNQTALVPANNSCSLILSQSSTISILNKLESFGLVNMNNKENKFIEGVNALIGEESTLDKISSAINKPLPNETEAEFVKRAKKQISDILLNLMSDR